MKNELLLRLLPVESRIAYDAITNAKVLVGKNHAAHRQLEIASKMLLLSAERAAARREISECVDKMVEENIQKAKGNG